MRKTGRKFAKGMTLIELMIGILASLIVVLTVAILIVAAHRNWNWAFDYANGDLHVNAIETMINFGVSGRKANKTDYKLYKKSGESFVPVLPSSPTNPVQEVFGDAVEFRYWDRDLEGDFMDTSVTGNAYVLYYVDNGILKAERGPYPTSTGADGTKYGGVNASGIRVAPTSTQILAKNVQSLVFSHLTKDAAGDGNGCVKMDLALYDSDRRQGNTCKNRHFNA